jgi:hypothetical protein
MSLKDWERDVLNRQRNIVFPDTNLNEGRFYRNIVYGKAVFSRGQKTSLLLIALYFLVFCSVALASAIGELVSGNKVQSSLTNLSTSMFMLAWLLFWVFLAVRGLFPAERKRIVRRGYRSFKTNVNHQS